MAPDIPGQDQRKAHGRTSQNELRAIVGSGNGQIKGVSGITEVGHDDIGTAIESSRIGSVGRGDGVSVSAKCTVVSGEAARGGNSIGSIENTRTIG